MGTVLQTAGGCSGTSGRTVLAEGSPTRLAALLLVLMLPPLALPARLPQCRAAVPRGLNMNGAVAELAPLSITGVSCRAGSRGLRAGKLSDSRARLASAGCPLLLVRLLGLAAAGSAMLGCCCTCCACMSSCAVSWAAEIEVEAMAGPAVAATGGEGARGRRGASSGVTGMGREPEAGKAGTCIALPGRQGRVVRAVLAKGEVGSVEAAGGEGRHSTTSLMATSSHLSPCRAGWAGEGR